MKKTNKQKRILVILLVSLLFVSSYILVFNTTEVQGAQIVDSFDAPGSEPTGLAWDGQYLWCAIVYPSYRIYKLNPSTGEILHSIRAPNVYPRGLTWDGENLWVIDLGGGSNKMYKLDPSTGEILKSYAIYGGEHGLTWDGQHLWHVDEYTEKIYKVSPYAGEEVHSIKSPGQSPKGLAWDGECLWCADSDADKIYKMNPNTGEVYTSTRSPGSFPTGLAWDGQYLWNADNNSNKIYKLEVQESSFCLGTLLLCIIVPVTMIVVGASRRSYKEVDKK